MATAPRPGAGLRAEAENTAVTIKVDGEIYTFRPTEVTARQSGAVRSATGRSLRSVLETAEDDPDIDTIAVLVWLARLQAGERKLSYAEVAESITYGVQVESVDDEPEDDDSPEA